VKEGLGEGLPEPLRVPPPPPPPDDAVALALLEGAMLEAEAHPEPVAAAVALAGAVPEEGAEPLPHALADATGDADALTDSEAPPLRELLRVGEPLRDTDGQGDADTDAHGEGVAEGERLPDCDAVGQLEALGEGVPEAQLLGVETTERECDREESADALPPPFAEKDALTDPERLTSALALRCAEAVPDTLCVTLPLDAPE
jgi:hypothetical protein